MADRDSNSREVDSRCACGKRGAIGLSEVNYRVPGQLFVVEATLISSLYNR